ncbi:MAG: hypothetical protein ACLFO2_04780 [Candidatus Woesearchaeota archaeon]
MIVIKYGGSILNPDGKYDEQAIDHLAGLLARHPKEIFCLIIGGGKICRRLQEASMDILTGVIPEDQKLTASDEVGIAVTKINARYLLSRLKPRFGDDVCPEPLIDPHARPPTGYRIYLATGAKPGHSTDYDMMVLAESFDADKAIKLSDFPVVLDVPALKFDKEKVQEYQPLPEMSWGKMRELVGDKWVAGGNYPLDPAACQVGKSRAYKGFSLLIGQYSELDKMVAGKPFKGTVVHGR